MLRKTIIASLAASVLALTAGGLYAASTGNPDVGGAHMYPSKNIIENALNSKDHTTLVKAVKAAGLVETLEGKGPFTVFAPTNAAFAKLPKGTVESLLKPENKEKLVKILTYHVLAGKAPSRAAITKMTKDDDNKHLVKAVSGDTFTTFLQGGKLKIKDESGHVATVTIADVKQSNGVIHVIDTVLIPK
ncbi:MAG: fasciclin domain-containing protein [Hyphomicrobiaceae bacterium]